MTGISFHRGPAGEHGGGAHLSGTLGDGCLSPPWPHWGTWGGEVCLLVTLRISQRTALAMEHLSLWEIC